LTLSNRVQLVVVCGHNLTLRQEIQALAETISKSNPVQLMVIGYTTAMDEFMTACEIIVGKPGGLTTSEALAKGLAFVVHKPIPGQEERNAGHLIAAGAGLRCRNLSEIRETVCQLLADPVRLRNMQSNSRAMGHPDAAAAIVRKLISLSGDK
jgi:processive 1,2-diacylglycerol beta-glucosyltransferase